MTLSRKPRPRAVETAKPQGQRLAKVVALMVPCSRSEAEQYIEGGWVQVDGVVVEDPPFRVLNQKITLDPHASLINLTPVTLVLNKPPGLAWEKSASLLTPANHCPQDRSGIRMLKRHFQKLENPVPMENGASGLVVFTQDWRTVRKLTEDMESMEHEIIADVKGEPTDTALQAIARALNNERNPLPHTKFSVNSSSEERSKLRFAIKGAHPGLVAFLCEKANLEILAMRRIRVGRVALSDLPIGQWRYLEAHERF
jgi:23S rRNA pseudouridine2604 synthase